jgi:hypothetical protein
VKLARDQWVAALLPVADGLDIVAAEARRTQLVRLTADGARRGSATLRFPFGGDFRAQSIARRADGGLLLGGAAGLETGRDGDLREAGEMALAAVTAAGARDARFGAPQRLSATVRARHDSLAGVARHGLRVSVGLGRRGVADVVATAHGRTIARGRVVLLTGRATEARLRLWRAGRQLVRRGGRLRVTVAVAGKDLPGNVAGKRVRVTLPSR